MGKPLLGGSFTLVGTDGIPVTDSQFRGKYLLIYFGFTNCPDICPEEMKKIATVMDTIDPSLADKIVPIFITLDPGRDSCDAVAEYVKGMLSKQHYVDSCRLSFQVCWLNRNTRADTRCYQKVPSVLQLTRINRQK